MAVAYDWLTLDADEEVVWSDTPHPYSLVPAIVVGVPLAVVLVGVPILVGAYLSHRNTHYVVTTDALYKKTGVLSRNVQRIEFDKVQDTSYRQSFLGAHFGYGTVDVSTAGGGGVEMSFGNVAGPQELQTLINERLRATGGRRGDEDRDAEAVLAEILTELRAIRSAVGGEPTDPIADETGPAGPDPSTADDPTGRLDGGETYRDETGYSGGTRDGEETTAGRSTETAPGERSPESAPEETAPEGGGAAADGEESDTDPDAFEFEDRR